MTKPKTSSPLQQAQFSIRPAQPEDVGPCSRLDGSYQTNYVWQMYFQESEYTLQVTFNRVRLPRTMTVDYPFDEANLHSKFTNSPNLFVAAYHDTIIGCIEFEVVPTRQTVGINHLIVHPQLRRRGMGRRLLEIVRKLAAYHRCRVITMNLQTKNDPAIAFVEKAGFVYCGYNDRYYRNGDISLIFSLSL